MLEILLLRHGIAQELQPGLLDHDRALTQPGRLRSRAVVERLIAMELHCQGIFSSSLLRARQTAQIAVEAGLLLPGGQCQIEPGLAPGADARAPGADGWALVQRLRQQVCCDGLALDSRWALVGHEPDLGDLAALLIGAPAGTIPLKKAGIALLQLGPGAAQLRLLMAPRQILAG
ncbi:histidine phosphatase family protein [Cyanobium sp. WAJ14-Wanaka]|uniref:SixA phosphatase family protein n=1 Tax=Cyanobium sp. WAJ14-Wanaka TaxID=2823725 RepID=UPI0020CF8268|nr:histidine phosphatase family protein [Cyanobium sp. WAJ14-Wanaka]MCP9775351.1 histidine phosphatase family protein [Cyanobium sp. WAJ14-Wanaka]